MEAATEWPAHSPTVTFLSPVHKTTPLVLAPPNQSAREGILNGPSSFPDLCLTTLSP